MKNFLLLLLVFLPFLVTAQETITESFGTTGSTTSIASFTGYDVTAYSYSGTGDVRNSTSSGINGSNDANILLNSSSDYIQIEGLNSNSNCTSIDISYSLRKSSNAQDGSDFGVFYSTDGTNFILISRPTIATGSGTTTSYVTYNTSLTTPPVGIVAIRFANDGSSEQFRLDAFSISGVGIDCALPVEFLHFTSTPLPNAIQLDWATATEKNNAQFEVERSSDATNWETLDIVKGNGTSLDRIDYRWVDATPARGVNYYRLKQVDLDGAFEYSKTVQAVFNTKTKIALTPNPTKGQFAIFGLDEDVEADVRLFNLAGQLQQQWQVQAGSELSTFGLEQGVYIIHVTQGNESFVERLIVH